MATQESDNGEPDDFARTDLRTGQPTPERPRRAIGRDLLGRLRAHITASRAVVAAIITLLLAALVATQLGYTQRLLDVARYRAQMIGVPELTETTIAPQPAAQLPTPNWEKVSLPAPASQIKDFSADPTDPTTLAVCGISSLDTPTIHGEMTQRGPVWIWLTHNAGKTWVRGQWPPITGTYCWLSRAADAPQRLTLLIEHPSSIDPRCSEYDLLLSDDNGVTWRPSPTTFTPTDDVVTYCEHYAFSVGARHYLYTNWGTPPDMSATKKAPSLAHSDDGGRHWSEMNPDSTQYLNSRTTYLRDGTIITANWSAHQENSDDTTVLWASTDRGDTWRPFSILHGIVGQRILPSLGAQSLSATANHPLYLSYDEHLPSRLLYIKAAQIADNRHWAYLPPLPAPGTSADHVGVTSLLGVTASSKLLAFGVNPQTGIQTDKPPEEQFDQQWLWSWDSHTQRWTSLAPPLPVAWTACSDGCWQSSLAKSATSQQTILWVRGFVDKDGANDLYRLVLPTEIA